MVFLDFGDFCLQLNALWGGLCSASHSKVIIGLEDVGRYFNTTCMYATLNHIVIGVNETSNQDLE